MRQNLVGDEFAGKTSEHVFSEKKLKIIRRRIRIISIIKGGNGSAISDMDIEGLDEISGLDSKCLEEEPTHLPMGKQNI